MRQSNYPTITAKQEIIKNANYKDTDSWIIFNWCIKRIFTWQVVRVRSWKLLFRRETHLVKKHSQNVIKTCKETNQFTLQLKVLYNNCNDRYITIRTLWLVDILIKVLRLRLEISKLITWGIKRMSLLELEIIRGYKLDN